MMSSPQQKPLNSLKIGLDLCGSDAIAQADALKQRAQPRVFCLLFCGKKVNANARHEGRKACAAVWHTDYQCVTSKTHDS